jgi:hypothetical protein
VFDRLIQLMHERATASDCPNSQVHHMPRGWERCCAFLSILVLQPPMMPAFYPLQYTFLSQIGHREDFRIRLAKLYAEWRGYMAEDFAPELANKEGPARVSPQLFASLVQAILHGVAIQRAADPDAFDRQEMLDLIVDLLGTYLRGRSGRRTGSVSERSKAESNHQASAANAPNTANGSKTNGKSVKS